MNFNFSLPYQLSHLAISQGATEKAFYVSLTILLAILADLLLKSLIRVPKHFDNRRARTFTAFLRNIVTTLVYVFATYTVFTLLNINLTPLLAYASIIGVIIGISSRTILEDFVNGIFLLSLDSIAIGDYVKIDDTPGAPDLAEGVVERIGIRTISLRSYIDGALYVIPNGKVKKFVNYSRPKSSVQIDIALFADQSIDAVLKAADNALTQLKKDEELGKFVFADSKVNGIEDFQTFGHMILRVSVFTSAYRRLEIARKYRYYIKKEFEKQKLKIKNEG